MLDRAEENASMPKGILIFGANGSGKTTLGRALADRLGMKHIEVEDYAFEEAEIPFSVMRARADCVQRMRADIDRYGDFVLTAVNGDFGEALEKMYRLAVWLTAPANVRLQRIEAREKARFGARVAPGGDMYEQQQRFRDFVCTRSYAHLDAWAETLHCPLLRLDGTDALDDKLDIITAEYRRVRENDGI